MTEHKQSTKEWWWCVRASIRTREMWFNDGISLSDRKYTEQHFCVFILFCFSLLFFLHTKRQTRLMPHAHCAVLWRATQFGCNKVYIQSTFFDIEFLLLVAAMMMMVSLYDLALFLCLEPPPRAHRIAWALYNKMSFFLQIFKNYKIIISTDTFFLVMANVLETAKSVRYIRYYWPGKWYIAIFQMCIAIHSIENSMFYSKRHSILLTPVLCAAENRNECEIAFVQHQSTCLRHRQWIR